MLQTTLENIVGKGKIARDEQIFLFPQCFPPYQKIMFQFHHILKCHLETLSSWDSREFVVWERVNILCSYIYMQPNCALPLEHG